MPHYPVRMVGILLMFLVLLIAASLWGVRRYVCFRRRDCCGKGCGCLFPAKRP
ncbi:MAG: hypothetical protein U1F61_03725 [Opitutaceae bacterium]